MAYKFESSDEDKPRQLNMAVGLDYLGSISKKLSDAERELANVQHWLTKSFTNRYILAREDAINEKVAKVSALGSLVSYARD